MDFLLLSLGLISLLFIFIYTYLTQIYNYWEKKGIPSVEKCLPFVGNMGKVLAMQEAFSSLCENIYKKNPHKSMIGFYQMLTPSLIVRDPELVKKVLITNFSSFEDNQIVLHPELDPLLSKNPFFSQKDTWKQNRTVLTNGFSSSKLKLMFTLTREVSFKFNNFLKTKLENINSFEFDLKKLFSLYTGEIVSTVGLGVEGDCFKENSESFGNAVTSVFDNPAINGGFGQVAVFYLPRLAKFLKYGIVSKEMDKFMRESVMKIKETTKGEKIPRNDFLHIISENEKEKINADNLASYMLAFILDAHETTNITLSFLALQLAIYSDVQEKVRREIISIGAKCDENWKYETLNELVYLEQAIFESMRLNSALGSLMKICTSKVQLDGFDGLSCQVEPGNIVVLSVHGLHKDPEYWPEPEKFDPDRFSEENRKDRHKFVFLPFGEGPRMCLGRRLAMMSMKMGIIAVLRNFSLELSPRTCLPLKPDPTSFFTAVDSSMWVIFRPLK
ncbi:cytochrome P450 9e2-like [Leptopilina heterotoma]|uniref:cytochrome P450 9e2-like n=1 Tax=Leptopilina heterotoma TaxID=63436 RepID=UPI001CA93BC1|nr:cytochrome P450 9e2-like [Leptopilina heterotoma]